MPKIDRWAQFPEGVRQHLIDRMRDRAISVADLNQLRLWIDTQPEVPAARPQRARPCHKSKYRTLRRFLPDDFGKGTEAMKAMNIEIQEWQARYILEALR